MIERKERSIVRYYGIKIGSKYTVVYGEGMSAPERIPTCVAKEEIPHRKGEFDYFFGREAEQRVGAVFPILHGMPRGNGEEAELIDRFLRFLKDKYDVPSDSYIVFCHPAMRADADAERFKITCKSIDWGKGGARFSLEALCGAIDALGGIDETRSPLAISVLNFGSSTLEMVMFVNLRKVGGAGMRTVPHGGSEIDKMVAILCSEQARGGEIGDDIAREWKEKYANLDEPQPFTEKIFIQSESGSREVSFPAEGSEHPIVAAYDDYTLKFLQHYDKYLGDLRLENEKVVNSLMRGSGVTVCTGSVVNTPGFGKFVTNRIQGKFTRDLRVVVSQDGVTGPAKGAYALARYIATGE